MADLSFLQQLPLLAPESLHEDAVTAGICTGDINGHDVAVCSMVWGPAVPHSGSLVRRDGRVENPRRALATPPWSGLLTSRRLNSASSAFRRTNQRRPNRAPGSSPRRIIARTPCSVTFR